MQKRRLAGFVRWFLLLLGVLSLIVFSSALCYDWRTNEMEGFELVARVAGYALALAIDGFSAAAAARYQGCGSLGRAGGSATGGAFATVIFLCAHDVLLFNEYGNQLDGVFTMAAFFALDAALLALYIALLVLTRRKRAGPARRAVLAGIVLLWAVYIVGDSAGYPAAHLYNWGEATMKLALLCHGALLLLFDERNAAEDGNA